MNRKASSSAEVVTPQASCPWNCRSYNSNEADLCLELLPVICREEGSLYPRALQSCPSRSPKAAGARGSQLTAVAKAPRFNGQLSG